MTVTSENEPKKRLAIATNQLANLNKLWNSNGISVRTKVKLRRSLIISIALYGCDTWAYSKQIEKILSAFEL